MGKFNALFRLSEVTSKDSVQGVDSSSPVPQSVAAYPVIPTVTDLCAEGCGRGRGSVRTMSGRGTGTSG